VYYTYVFPDGELYPFFMPAPLTSPVLKMCRQALELTPIGAVDWDEDSHTLSMWYGM